MTWQIRLSRLIGLDGLGPDGAAGNAARSLTEHEGTSSSLEDFLRRFPSPSGAETAASSGLEREAPASCAVDPTEDGGGR